MSSRRTIRVRRRWAGGRSDDAAHYVPAPAVAAATGEAVRKAEEERQRAEAEHRRAEEERLQQELDQAITRELAGALRSHGFDVQTELIDGRPVQAAFRPTGERVYLTVDRGGNAFFDMEGFAGRGCLDLSRKLDERLGEAGFAVSDEVTQLKPEAMASDDEGHLEARSRTCSGN